MELRTVLRMGCFRIWLLLLTGLGVVLCLVPLFNLLGYEFCLALALAGSLAGLHLGAAQVASARRLELGLVLALRGPVAALLLLLARVAANNLLLLVPPLALISLNALRVKNCDPLEGLAFFAMMPLLSVTIASAAGALWALLLPRPRLAAAAAVLTLIGSLAWGLARFHGSPSVLAYDPFAGYFPGTIYDEQISIGATFLLYRLHNLLWLGAAVAGAALLFDPLELRLRRGALAWRPAPLLLALACLVGGGAMFTLRAPLGFAVDAAHIAETLGGRLRTAHFDLHFPTELTPRRRRLLAADHEHRHHQLRAFFGGEPGRITSYIFRSVDEKRRLMGAGRTFIAKPWRREVYLQDLGFPHPVLKHELAHVFGAPHGDPVFGVSLRWPWLPLPLPSFNVGLIEGLAVAADWRSRGEADTHQLSAALTRLGLAPPLRSLFGVGFMAHSAGRAYTLAGSFCRFLFRRHGARRLLAVYRSGGDFEGAYGAGNDLGALLARWGEFLRGVEVPPRVLQLARERFRRPGIARRVCGHEVASLGGEADRLQARGRWAEALALRNQVCSFEPGDPGHHLERVHTLVGAGELTQARKLATALLEHPALSKPMERRVKTLLGDLSWWEGRPGGAARWYRGAARLAAGPGGRRVLLLKRWALDQGGTARRLLRRYIAPSPAQGREAGLDVHLAHRIQGRALEEPRGPRAAFLGAPRPVGLGLYLVGKQLAAHDHCEFSIDPLKRALALGLPDRDFQVEALLSLGRCQLGAGQAREAAATFSSLGALPLPAGTALRAADWLDRARWWAENGPDIKGVP